jgi:hypothetical protein
MTLAPVDFDSVAANNAVKCLIGERRVMVDLIGFSMDVYPHSIKKLNLQVEPNWTDITSKMSRRSVE